MKLKKDGVIKDIHGEKEIGDYMAAGWTKIEKEKTIFEKDKN